MQAAAKRVQHREHFGQTYGRLPTFQFDKEAETHASRRSQLILA